MAADGRCAKTVLRRAGPSFTWGMSVDAVLANEYRKSARHPEGMDKALAATAIVLAELSTRRAYFNEAGR
jgi:hypothetical protein